MYLKPVKGAGPFRAEPPHLMYSLIAHILSLQK